MTRHLLDTNILIRHLRYDDADQSPRAKALFAEAAAGTCRLLITPTVIAETVWVLRSGYQLASPKITSALADLIRSVGVVCEREAVVLDALRRCGETSLDIVDCLLVAQASLDGDTLTTFDRAIARKFTDIKAIAPI